MIRLARKPSLWMNFFGRLIFAVIWAGAFFAVSTWAWLHRFGTPTFILVALGFFDLIAIAVVWDIFVRFRRTLRHREPVVEVDHEPAAYGDSVQVHIVETDPESLAEMGVKLVGECYTKSEVDFTQHRETVVSLTRCYEEELLRLKPSTNEPINRILRVQLPKSAPANEVAWKIIVDSHLKQGGIIEHPFPIRVQDSA
jgi:hypothetical protein